MVFEQEASLPCRRFNQRHNVNLSKERHAPGDSETQDKLRI
jgi:hypothetical protein